MASIENQQATITELLDEATARTVRVLECHGTNTQPPRSVQEILRDVQGAGSRLLTAIVNRQSVLGISPDLFESWLVKSLLEARSAIAKIDGKRVRAARRAGQPTDQFFQAHIQEADNAFTAPTSGVANCIRECFNEQSRYKPEGIDELAEIRKLADVIRRRLRVVKSRALSAVFSGWLLTLVIAMSLVSVPAAYYFKVYKGSGVSTLAAAAPAVAASASADAARIRATAEKPEKSAFERAVSIVESIWKLIDDIPKIFAALATAWGLVRAWLRR